jgi:hypothetical protein
MHLQDMLHNLSLIAHKMLSTSYAFLRLNNTHIFLRPRVKI